MTELDKFLRNNALKQTELAKYLGCSRGYVCNMANGSKPISKEALRCILNNPYGWDTSALTDERTTYKAVASGHAHATLDMSNHHNVYSEPMQATAPAAQPANTIPLIPLEAQAGSLGDCTEGITLMQCERITSPIAAATCAIRIKGDSMSPKYPSGSIVFLNKINEKAYIEWGRCYVLDTDNGAVIKNIKKSDKDGEIICESLNPEYLPFEVNTQYIKGWYKVLGTLTLE